jgi:hypothetical protein
MKFTNRIILTLLIIILVTLSLIALACAAGKTTGEPSRESQSATPERGIEKPLRAERITQEEYDAAADIVRNPATNLVEDPVFAMPMDAGFEYLFYNNSHQVGVSKITTSSGENGDIIINDDVSIDWADESDKPYPSVLTMELDSKLRPVKCSLQTPDPFSQDMITKEVDFKTDKFGIDYPIGPGGTEPLFREIAHPDGDIWPFLPHANIDLAVIAFCMGPPEKDAEVFILNMVQDSVGTFGLEFIKEKEIQFDDGETTLMAKEYESRINGNFYGWLYFDEDGMLVKVEEAGGIIAELTILPTRSEE